MSKMKMPEMIVFRFTESDVICSSMPTAVRFTNFNDGKGHNGTIGYNGSTYGYGSADEQEDIWSSILYRDDISVERPGQDDIHLGNLIRTESDAGFSTDGVDDGVYYWDGDHTYKRKNS